MLYNITTAVTASIIHPNGLVVIKSLEIRKTAISILGKFLRIPKISLTPFNTPENKPLNKEPAVLREKIFPRDNCMLLPKSEKARATLRGSMPKNRKTSLVLLRLTSLNANSLPRPPNLVRSPLNMNAESLRHSRLYCLTDTMAFSLIINAPFKTLYARIILSAPFSSSPYSLKKSTTRSFQNSNHTTKDLIRSAKVSLEPSKV